MTDLELGSAIDALATADHGLDLSRVGGSDAGAVLGLSPWSGPLDVWLRCVFGPRASDDGNEAMAWGRRLEPVILAAWAGPFGLDVERPASRLIGDVLRASPDAILSGHTLVEVKATSTAPWDDVPPYYVAQVQFVAHAFGLADAVLVALHAGNKLRPYKVRLDDGSVFNAVESWALRHVLPAQQARAEGRDPWGFAPPSEVQERPAILKAGDAVAGETEAALVADLEDVEAEIAELEAQRADLRARLLDAAGDASGLVLPDGRRVATPTVAGRSWTAWAKVAADLRAVHPECERAINELVERHTRIGEPSRQLRLPRSVKR